VCDAFVQEEVLIKPSNLRLQRQPEEEENASGAKPVIVVDGGALFSYLFKKHRPESPLGLVARSNANVFEATKDFVTKFMQCGVKLVHAFFFFFEKPCQKKTLGEFHVPETHCIEVRTITNTGPCCATCYCLVDEL